MHRILQTPLQKVDKGELQVGASMLRELMTALRQINEIYNKLEILVDAADAEPTAEERKMMADYSQIEVDFHPELYGIAQFLKKTCYSTTQPDRVP